MTDGRFGAVSQQLRQLAGVPTSDWSDRQLLESFRATRDEGVFAALVAPHGPLVLNVCRRQLGNRHDADDAFRATFALLAAKAESIRQQTALASWLQPAPAYHVAGDGVFDPATAAKKLEGYGWVTLKSAPCNITVTK